MSNIIEATEEFVEAYYKANIDSDYRFHSIRHARRTVRGVQQIGRKEGLDARQIEILTIAAWFHDIAIGEGYENHERRSADIAEKFLRDKGYDPDAIGKVTACIMSTEISREPEDLMEQVIRDADILHLGKKNFFKRNHELRSEWDKKKSQSSDDEQWLSDDIEFFNAHPFYTGYARKKYGEQRMINRTIIEDRLKKIRSGETPASGVSETANELSTKVARQIRKNKPPERGVETMFRVTSRNHFTLSGIADNKAGTLISISALIISIILSVLVRRLEEQPALIIPTVLLLLTLLGTIIFAVLSTRPKVTSLNLNREDIKQRKGNLLFFGNFINMPVEDYEWGMQEVMNDREYLYNNLIRDIYYLGIVLGKKYRYLRFAYDTFMYGLIISVLSYIIAFAL